jgi:putative ABC transport system permease protein
MSAPSPPALAERLLAITIRDAEWRDSILGDLAEEFAAVSTQLPSSAARRWYWRNALSLAGHRLARGVTGHRPAVRPEPEPEDPRAGVIAVLLQDLRYAWRTISHQPALSATVALVLAVALAANATTFALIDALVLRPFRYPGVDRAVVIASTGHELFYDRQSVAAGDFLDWREQAGDVVDRLAAIEWWDPNFTRDGPPQQLAGFRVSAALFEALGTRPILGRTLLHSDEDGGTPAVVLSQGFWERQFAGRRDVLGRDLRLDGVAYRVVGVMPSEFRVPVGADVWATLRMAPEARAERGRGNLMVVGRLRGDTSVDDAERRLQAILVQQKRAYPETHARREVSVRSYTDGFRDAGAGPFLAVWQVAALLLLLVACANVVNLVLARNTEREREFAVRLALGASTRRIAWQLMLEGLVLSGGAALLALPLVWASLQGIRAMMPDNIVRFVGGWPYMRMDGRTFVVTAALAVGATVMFGMVPAWRAARQSVTAGLRQGGRLTGAQGRQRARVVLASAQIALTLALLAGAGQCLAALYRVTEGPLGFEPAGILVGRLTLPADRYDGPEARRQFAERLLTRLGGIPAVSSAGFTSIIPYGGGDSSTSFWPEGVPPRQKDAVQVAWRHVTPNALGLMKVPLISGRSIETADRSDRPPVALVSQSLASRFWPGQSAVGHRFLVGPEGPFITVVGVVGDVTHHWLVGTARATLYRPFDQDPPSSFGVMLRTVADPIQLAADLRAAVQAVDPDQPVLDIRTLQRVVADGTVGLRIAARGLGVMALVSCLLSTIGLYGLISFLTGLRTREIGLRVALGASRWDVIKLTGATAAGLAAVGVMVGLALAYTGGRLLEQQLFGVITSNLPLGFGLAALLGVVSLAAGYIPARRAANVDPTIALRAE